MHNIDLYLHFQGNSEEVLTYYKQIFGGEFIEKKRYKDVPGSEKMSIVDQQKMMHISLKISPNTTLMASDLVVEMEQNLQQGNNIHICIQAESEKEADRFFNALANDGEIEMPMNRTFWGAYFGMCRDKFGIYWMINYSMHKNIN